MRVHIVAMLIVIWPTLVTADVNVIRDITYGQGATESGPIDLKLDLYTPSEGCQRACPTVLGVHGGGFRVGSKRHGILVALAETLAANGYGVALINYRLVGDQPLLSGPARRRAETLAAGLPERQAGRRSQIKAAMAAFDDVAMAMDWVGSNGASYGLEADQLVLMGSSAGAVAVLHVGYAQDELGLSPSPDVVGVVALQGLLSERVAFDRDDPALFILHGERDRTIPLSTAQTLQSRASQANVPVVFVPVAGAGHGLSNVAGPEISVRGLPPVDHMLAFLGDLYAGNRPQTICLSDAARLCP